MLKQKSLAIFASHNGSNFQKIVEACQSGELFAQVRCLYCNNPEAYVLKRAQKMNIPQVLIPQNRFKNFQEWDSFLVKDLKEKSIDWVILVGFMKKIGPGLIKAFQGRMINTHPSLLPKYGGKGMYGDRVHKAVLENQEKESGITIHFVTDEFDRGPIIAQKKIQVLETDTVESLSQRLKSMENHFLVETLKGLIR